MRSLAGESAFWHKATASERTSAASAATGGAVCGLSGFIRENEGESGIRLEELC